METRIRLAPAHIGGFSHLTNCPSRFTNRATWKPRWDAFRDQVTLERGEAYWDHLSETYELGNCQQEDDDRDSDYRR
jgi:hypothetical protein